MRILIVTPLTPPESGGPSYYSVALKEAFLRAGETVGLIAFKEVRKYPSGIRHLIFLYEVLFRALPVDTLIILDTVSVALPAVIAGWVLGKKTVVRVGGDFIWEAYIERMGEKVKLSEFYSAPRAFTKKERVLIWVQKHIVLRLATTIVFSTAWQRDLWRVPYGIPDAKTAIIENAHVRAPLLTKERAGERMGEAGREEATKNTFLWVGRDLVLKNVDTLTQAFEQVKEMYPQMALTLLSGVPHEEVEQALQTARCLVLPSVSEVSPNIVYEALAHSVPVICTADTGIRKSAPAGVVFVDTLDVSALVEALRNVCDQKKYQELLDVVHSTHERRTYDNIAADFGTL